MCSSYVLSDLSLHGRPSNILQVKTMESGLYIPKTDGTTPGSSLMDVTKQQNTPAIAPRGNAEAAGDSPAPALAGSLNPTGLAIHQSLADRLKAAKVPGYAGSQDSPAGILGIPDHIRHHSQTAQIMGCQPSCAYSELLLPLDQLVAMASLMGTSLACHTICKFHLKA